MLYFRIKAPTLVLSEKFLRLRGLPLRAFRHELRFLLRFAHRAELVYHEWSALIAYALLREYHRTVLLPFQHYRYNQTYRGCKNHPHQGKHHIEEPLHGSLHASHRIMSAGEAINLIYIMFVHFEFFVLFYYKLQNPRFIAGRRIILAKVIYFILKTTSFILILTFSSKLATKSFSRQKKNPALPSDTQTGNINLIHTK